MRKKSLFVALAVVLLALPFVVRWLYFYEGRYTPGEVARPDLAQIQVPTSAVSSSADGTPVGPATTAAASGTILVDQAHGNRFQMGDLNVLQARLAARGQRLEPVTAAEDLSQQLRYAKALIIISPGEDWTPDQVEQVSKFVDKGGRLLLVTDPNRYGVRFDELENPIIDDDVPHINDLAARFGLLFQPDYLYNTADNAGNFRNIKLTALAEHSLTEGLKEVAFYATHSIQSDQPALISTSGQTRSSTSERAAPLSVAVVAADDRVLALGDLTFMSEPYSANYDNDHLIANIADFLSSVQRQYDVADFPFYFDDGADLVYAGGPLLDSDLLRGGSSLQELFASKGQELNVQPMENKTTDTLFFGLYVDAEEVSPYLEAAQVTLLISQTETATDVEAAQKPRATPSPTATVALTVTPAATAALEGSGPKPNPTPAEVTSESEVAPTAEISPSAQNRIQIGSLGEMVMTGTLLLMLQNDGERQVMVVLADTEKGLGNAIERLTKGDMQGCLVDSETEAVARKTEAPTTSLALCPTGEVAAGEGSGGWQPPKPEPTKPTASPPVPGTVEPGTPPEIPTAPPGGAKQSILILALDKGKSRYGGTTDADALAAMLAEGYDVKVWSQSAEGLPAIREIRKYDLVIWSGGDYERPFGEEESNLLFLTMLEGKPVILCGAYISDAETQSVQRDIQVQDAAHPMAEGFKAGEVIGFVPGPTDGDYRLDVVRELEAKDQVIVFVRGPESEDKGASSVFAFRDEVSGVQAAFIGFPLYMLSKEVGTRLVLNTVTWMLAAG